MSALMASDASGDPIVFSLMRRYPKKSARVGKNILRAPKILNGILREGRGESGGGKLGGAASALGWSTAMLIGIVRMLVFLLGLSLVTSTVVSAMRTLASMGLRT